MLNRSALIVHPKQPYIDWALQLDDSGLAPNSDSERTIYLLPEYDDEFDALKTLSEAYDIVFEAELAAWHTEESDWPKNRTFAMFRDWFVYEFHSIVEDLCGYAVEDDEASF
ncbi:MAG TPA: hypothetical protein PKK10_10620 [Woeseiaceae bacterium]|nr:hypothetical protein [Woeseiaceae bacterium]